MRVFVKTALPRNPSPGAHSAGPAPIDQEAEGLVAQAAETVEADGAGARIAGLALIQGRRRLPSEERLFQPA